MAYYTVKLSAGGKLFASRVVKGGRVQKAFREKIGIPVGNCMKGKKGQLTTKAKKIQAVKDCTAQYRGMHIL